MLTRRALWGLLLGIAVLSTLGIRSASADPLDFDLTTPNAAVSGYPGPYVHVHVDLNDAGTQATITFTSLTQGSFQYLLGDGSSVALNTNGTVSVVGGVKVGNPDGVTWTGGGTKTDLSVTFLS